MKEKSMSQQKLRATRPARFNKTLAAAGWTMGEAEDFLDLSTEESALVNIRLALADAALQSRLKHALSQAELAKRMTSSQSRVAKIEAADPSVSIELMMRALLASGGDARAIARAIRS